MFAKMSKYPSIVHRISYIFIQNPQVIYTIHIFIFENISIRLLLHLKYVKCYHDDVILTSALRINFYL